MGDLGSRPPRTVRAATFESRGLLLAGMLLLLAAAGLQCYSFYAQMRWDRERSALSAQFVPAPALSDVTPAPALSDATPALTLSDATPAPALFDVTPVLTLSDATPAPALSDVTPAPPPLTPQEHVTPSVTGTPSAVATSPAATSAASPLATPATTPVAVATNTPRPSPTATPDDRSDPGRLYIPKLNVNAAIVTVPLINGLWDVSPLLYDVGSLEGTGWPGRAGNAAISGHVSLHGRGDGPFRWLERLVAGDEIFVDQGDTRYLYAVREVRVVLPSDVSVVAPTEDARTLTLITCTDWDFLKADYMKRLIVTATMTGKRRIGLPIQ